MPNKRVGKARLTQSTPLTNIHQTEGNVRMFNISEDKVDRLLAASGSIMANAFFFAGGGTLSIYLTLMGSGMADTTRLWLEGLLFWGEVTTAVFLFAFLRDAIEKQRVKNSIKWMPSYAERFKKWQLSRKRRKAREQSRGQASP